MVAAAIPAASTVAIRPMGCPAGYL
ncbi:protein of unknown function [Streptomyces sp. KY70]|nr:protein of unknown function [Streptomyces sp. KY70]